MPVRVLIIALWFYSCSAAAVNPTQTAGWFVETYGIAPDSNLAVRAKRVFTKVKRASKNAPSNTKLIIVKDGPKSLAIALPDRNIVVSLGTLKFAYHGVDCEIDDCSIVDCEQVDCELGDARLAFIFGHELAHQANRDFWIEGLKILGSKSTIASQLLHNPNQQSIRYEKENKADVSGFINASLAGFRTDRLIEQDVAKQSFIEYWVDQVGAVNPLTHPNPKDRATILREKFAALQSKSDIFKYGVRLAHFGRYDDAAEFLLTFEHEYPSRAVLNNLGYVYLQSARQLMPTSLSHRYWLPTLLETDPGYPHKSTVRGLGTEGVHMPETAIELLQIAKSFLLQAVELDKEDVVSRANLVAVYLYLGKKAGTARDLVEEMSALLPFDNQIEGLRALVLYEQEPNIAWKQAINILQPLSQLPGTENNILYNYGRLLQERKRTGAAKNAWTKLLNQQTPIPNEYRREVCRVTAIPDCEPQSKQKIVSEKDVFWNMPLQHGDDVNTLNNPLAHQQLADWHDTGDTQIGYITARILTAKNGDNMLALGNKIEFATLISHPFQSADDLLLKMGTPSIRYPLAEAELWSYGTDWSALVDNDEVKEIWISRP